MLGPGYTCAHILNVENASVSTLTDTYTTIWTSSVFTHKHPYIDNVWKISYSFPHILYAILFDCISQSTSWAVFERVLSLLLELIGNGYLQLPYIAKWFTKE